MPTRKIFLQFLVVVSTVIATEACKPCYNVKCATDTTNCRAGVVKDICGCCDVCAKGEGDNCGGLYHFHGKCGDDLVCISRRPNTVKVLGENDYIPGVCEPSTCGSRKCGFNQRCQLNQRGKARCVCPRYCKRRYMPVCGLTNGRQYTNRCFLRRDECKAQQRIGYVDGPCKKCYENGKAYKFGEEISRPDKCEICFCVHGNWRCEQDEDCPGEAMPQFCHVKNDDCPRGTYCQGGKFEPEITALDIGLGICIPTDEAPTTDDSETNTECPKLKCGYCRYGYQITSRGCQSCACTKGSVAKNTCDRPKYPGRRPCYGYRPMKRFYFNQQKGRCLSFMFSGCLSNGNNFSSKRKCELHCMSAFTKQL